MRCRCCQSENQRNFPGEINIHFVGIKNLEKPSVRAFPKLTVCLDCGFTVFQLEENELRLLVEGSAEQGAVAHIRSGSPNGP